MDLLNVTKDQLGDPYVYGGSYPGGFDCSGLTSYVYARNGYRIQRRASLQMADGIIVPRQELQVGDLVFFRVPNETTLCSHVGIYAGDGQIIHAGSRGIGYADLSGAWFDDYYFGARRLVLAGPAPGVPVAVPTGSIPPFKGRPGQDQMN